MAAAGEVKLLQGNKKRCQMDPLLNAWIKVKSAAGDKSSKRHFFPSLFLSFFADNFVSLWNSRFCLRCGPRHFLHDPAQASHTAKLSACLSEALSDLLLASLNALLGGTDMSYQEEIKQI